MACPYFEPREILEDRSWASPPRVSLGEPRAGVCHALPAAGREPDSDTLRELCNLGYARGHCPRFPEDGAGDAVRFSVAADGGRVVRIHFILEKEHFPLEHGVLEYTVESATFGDESDGALLGKQARAFVESYLRRKAPS